MNFGFTGGHEQKIDAKGRVSIPADFRRQLEVEDPEWTEGLSTVLYMNFGSHLKRHLRVYTVQEFAKVTARVRMLKQGTPQRKALSKMMLTDTIKLEVDKDGRIVMPKALREKLEISEGLLKFAGVADYFEIWRADVYAEEVETNVEDWLAEQGEDFDPDSLLDV